MEDIKKYLDNLPVIPEVAMKIISYAESNIDLSFAELEQIIKIDTAITSKILKVANSALYARQMEIKNLEKAISLLGFKTIKNLVLILSTTSAFKAEASTNFFKEFWANSVLTAFYSKELAISLSLDRLSEDVFLAGLIHKIGQVALFRHDTKKYEEIIENSCCEEEELKLEKEKFGFDHKIIGSEILKEWSFPELFIDCSKEYGANNIVSKYKKEIIIVTLADIMAREVLTETDIFNEFPSDHPWINNLGMSKNIFMSERDIIINKVNNDPNFKECNTLVF